ncbi:TonB-dependent siderophore receptor [Caulobacter sp. 17J80-11]|uniref:TonB-dependent receptor plug domain-containing protein n=1 Tax=Caulobacter sp. 17J80-11 TaxID=2763502 RepID=UPI001653EAA6|nr:TonB-dependent receptor [Caulobacter sp. 17J80-11]MBC6982210.1 TonB-dependent receptor [Caulobacter sp. 17J80-11]
MKTSMWVAAMAMAVASQAHAQATETSAPAPAAGQDAAQGVIAYPPSFFAEAQPNTAMDMIARLPGFTFNGGDNVRGFGGAAGNVLIDGERPASKTDNLESIIRRIPASQVERIELIRGAAPGIDMQGQTVLVNVVRKKAGGVTGLIGVSNTLLEDGRDHLALRLESTRRWDDKTLEGSFVVAEFVDDGAGDGPRVRTDADGNVLLQSYPDTEGDGWQAVGTAAFETPLAGGKLRTNVMVLREGFFYDSIDRLPYGDEVQHDVQDKLLGEFGVRYSRNLGPRTSIEAVGLQQIRDINYVSDFNDGSQQRFELDRLSGESVVRGVLRFKQSDTLSYEAGGEVAYNWQESETGFSIDGTDIPLPAADVRVTEKRAEVFGTGTWRPSPKLTLEAGLRVETSTISSEGDVELEKTLVFPKPRAVATWSPNDKNQLRFRVERQVDQLNFNDFVANANLATSGITVANPDIEPGQAWVVEAAYERRFWKDGAVTVTLRHAELSDVVDRVPVEVLGPDGPDADSDPDVVDVFDAPGNIGKGKNDEVALSVNLPLDRLGVKGGLLRGEGTWRVSEVTDPTIGAGRRISGQHPFDGEFHFSQDVTKWKTTWGVDVFNSWREEYFKLDRIETFDLGTWGVLYAEYKPRTDLSIRVELDNFGRRPFTQTQEVWNGPRDTAALDYRDRRDLKFGHLFYIRVRKTLGG